MEGIAQPWSLALPPVQPAADEKDATPLKQAGRQAGGQAGGQADRQAGRHAGRQACRQADRQA